MDSGEGPVRVCAACTLLCEDDWRTSCELCGGALAPAAAAEAAVPRRRACPACTLLCDDDSRTSCELCDSQLPPLAAPAAPVGPRGGAAPEARGGASPPKRRKSQVAPGSAASARSIRAFFGQAVSSPPSEPAGSGPPQLPAPGESAGGIAPGAPTEQHARRAHALQLLGDGERGGTREPQLQADVEGADLSLPLESYDPQLACWRQAGAAVPYRHLAATLDALEATRSRLAKDLILVNSFRSMLALGAPPSEVEAACYLLAPAKDAQTGGHRLRPDWAENGKPLSIPSSSITAAVLEATGASRADFRKCYQDLHESGEVALALRERGGRQKLLRAPPPLKAGTVRAALLGLAGLSGQGVEKAKTQRLTGLLRAATGTEVKWLVRTFLPHMAAGISLEASVLPALGAAAVLHLRGGGGRAAMDGEVREAQEAVRTGFALRPDVGVLVGALLDGGVPGVQRCCVLHVGVPMQPMLAKPSVSIDDLLQRIAGALPGSAAPVWMAAEHKYDGQRAQIHRTPRGEVRIFSRKIDDMTYKYPDVVKVICRCARSARALVLDAEIVPILPSPAAQRPDGEEGVGKTEIAAFQSLSTRKRKNVTEANAASESVAVKVFLFDLLLLGDEVLLRRPFSERRAALRSEFAEDADVLGFATAVDVDLAGHLRNSDRGQEAGPDSAAGQSEPAAAGCGGAPLPEAASPLGERDLAAAASAPGSEPTAAGALAPRDSARDRLGTALRAAVSGGCEGLMVKRLDSPYEPSTKRSDCWLKLKKDYIDSMGDSLDLVPIGGWRGSGRKSRWVSPWLLATFDPAEGTFGSVCRVMSGFTDSFYAENTVRYLGAELKVGRPSVGGARVDGAASDDLPADEGGSQSEREAGAGAESDADCGGDQELEPAGRTARGLLRSTAAPGVETGESCQFWFEPTEVWEIRGADITVSPKHMAARGAVDPKRGLSLRFPRFIRKREDKSVRDATTPEQLAAMFRAQSQRR